jgi:CheY-like chemotaxis protein
MADTRADRHPAEPPATGAAPPGGRTAASGTARRRRALVVDDDVIGRRVLEKILGGSGFQVLTAEDGLSGLRALVDEILDLDVVVTDVRMPRMDGVELIRRIREAGGEKDLGIVVVTGTIGNEERLCAMGADAVIGKTADVAAIAAAIESASARAARARALVALEESA